MKAINGYLIKPINEKLKRIGINTKNTFANVESLVEYIKDECGFVNLDEGTFTRGFVLGQHDWSFEEINNRDSKENETLLDHCQKTYNIIKDFNEDWRLNDLKEKLQECNCKLVYSKGTKGPNYNSLAFVFVYRKEEHDDPVLFAMKISNKNLMTFKCIKK